MPLDELTEKLRAESSNAMSDGLEDYGIPMDQAADEIIRLRTALADAVRRPMGVVPVSAEGLLSEDDYAAAEKRRKDKALTELANIDREIGLF